MKGSTLIIGIGKPSGGPPPRPKGMSGMPDLGAREDEAPEHRDDERDTGKASPEEALVIRAGHDCDDCRNYHADTGDCDKVEGTFSPEDQCLRYFEAKDEGHSDDEDEAAESEENEGREPEMGY